MRATRKALEARAAELGAVVEWGEYSFNVDTPRGFLWASTGTSTLAVPFANPGADSWRPEAYAEAIEGMAMGLEPAPEDYDGWWTEPD